MAHRQFESLAQAIQPYKTQSICQALGVSRVRVSAWRSGNSLPSIRFIPALANLMRLDIAELTQIIAADDQLREDKRDAA